MEDARDDPAAKKQRPAHDNALNPVGNGNTYLHYYLLHYLRLMFVYTGDFDIEPQVTFMIINFIGYYKSGYFVDRVVASTTAK